MTKQINWRRIGSLVLTAIALLFTADQAAAQKKDYNPGERIEWKSSGYPETWVEAIFVRASPDGSQPIIREMPSEFSKDGFQRGTSWADIRPLSAKTPGQPTVKDDQAGPPAPLNTDMGTGLMTQADVLAFLQARMGDKPFQNPRREEIKLELAELVKARGLDFRYANTAPDFFSKLAKFNAITSEVSFPLRDNYGAPTKQAWLMGAWKLGKTGAAVDYVRNDRVYRQGEIGVGNVGTLTLKADGGYTWKAAAKDSTAGKWRKATHTEMRSQGGDGIVLLGAKGGQDWIVTHDRGTTLKGDWINVAQLNSRSIKEFGSRGR